MAGDRFGVWDRAAVPLYDEPRRARRTESLVARGVVEAAQERDLLYQEIAEKDDQLRMLCARGDYWQEQARDAQTQLDKIQQEHWTQNAEADQRAQQERDTLVVMATQIMDIVQELTGVLETYADEWNWDAYPAGQHDRIVFVCGTETQGWQLALRQLRGVTALTARLEAQLEDAHDQEVPF
jgi:hypothetical protein